MQGENANKNHYVYKTMVVQQICNRCLDSPSENRNQIVMLIKFRVVYF